ncbi:metallophosphoesterase [Nocardiopsis sp. CC223A]|uniref:metallophosphoesterase n=1 Tax=Nocardiopsis sp. CC223A TaxID=3044051 RepID=UPI00278C7A89|nr:metallophosphoesterase [Nocardiopsis sp. CC223A]
MPSPVHTIIQLSDVHIVGAGEPLHGQDTVDHLATALRSVEEAGIPLSALLLSGDLADAGDPRSYEILREAVEPVAERLGVPALYMMGNHDERGALRAGLLDEPGSDAPLYYVHRIGGLRIVVLDSTVPGHHHGELGEEQLEWLREELASPAPEGTVLGLHHSPIPSPLPLMDPLGLRSPEKLADVLRGSDVRMVLSGHAHHPAAGAFAGIPAWISGALAYSGDTLAPKNATRGLAGSAFTRVDVYPDAVVASSVPLVRAGTGALYEIDAEQLDSWAPVPETDG